jgi:histidinol dehydrogenase
MKVIIWKDLTEDQRRAALQRPASAHATEAEASVRAILDDVKKRGDGAVRDYTKKFDGYDPEPVFVSEAEIARAESRLDQALAAAIRAAYKNIMAFHKRQGYATYELETMPGLTCSRAAVPVERVGLYIPGGTAPLLSTALMLGVPSQIAGNPQRILCTPADKKGAVHPAILFAATLCGIGKIARIGGAQAIAALAYGTQTVSAADKIFGPGNIYVTLAKAMAAQEAGGPAVDMPAGPSEVLVIVDDAAPDRFAAADLLAQAEHDVSAQVVLVATSKKKIASVMDEVKLQLASLPRAKIAARALENSLAIVASSLDEAIAISNRYAPEHLILCFEGAERYKDKIINAGSVFCGPYTPESLGDYASGTNHVLPTAAAARAYGGLGVESFQKTITWQTATRQGLSAIGPAVITLAGAETLQAHARAVELRLKENKP